MIIKVSVVLTSPIFIRYSQYIYGFEKFKFGHVALATILHCSSVIVHFLSNFRDWFLIKV